MSPPVFVTGSLMGHVTRMTMTASIGLVAIFAVDFVDLLFISMLGNTALAAAVGYAGTLLFFTNSMNIGLSIAAGSLVARSIGAGDTLAAREHASSVAVAALILGVLVPLLVWAHLETLFTLLGASGEALEMAIRYSKIILPSMGFMGLAMTAGAVLRAYGDAKRSMYTTLAGGVVNAVLDPLLIFTFDLGLEGAAIASVIARIVMGSLAFGNALRVHNAYIHPRFEMLRRDTRAVSAIAGPAILTNFATPFGAAIVTRLMAPYGTDAVAGMAVIGRLIPMAFGVVLALSGAIGPIVGQNYGAKAFPRVTGALMAAVQFVGIYVVLATLLLFVFRSSIADLFEAEGVTRDLLYLFCGVLALSHFFNGLIFIANASFNNLGHPLYSSLMNWGRQTLGTWPLAVLCGSIWGAGGVLIGQAIGGVFFGCIAIWLAFRVARSLDETPDVTRKIDPFAPQRNTHQHTHRGRW